MQQTKDAVKILLQVIQGNQISLPGNQLQLVVQAMQIAGQWAEEAEPEAAPSAETKKPS